MMKKIKEIKIGQTKICDLIFEMTIVDAKHDASYGATMLFFGAYSEQQNTVSVGLHIGPTISIGISIPKINEIVKNYEWGWRLGGCFWGRYFQFDFFNRKEQSHIFIDFLRLVIGNPKSTDRELSFGEVEITLPEGRYDAEFKIVRYEFYYPRVAITRYKDKFTVKVINGSIPVKREDGVNDGVTQMSTYVDYDKFSLKNAVEDLAMTILRQRQKVGSLDQIEAMHIADEIVNEAEKIKRIINKEPRTEI